MNLESNAKLDSSLFANKVIDYCSSTNDLAKQLGEQGFPHGSWVSAHTQKNGRGRHGRTWQSEEGGLFLSLLIRPTSKDEWTWIPLATAVGITTFLKTRFPLLNIKIKWPNDLMLQNAKLGGILCEGTGKQAESFVVVGVGLNCLNSPKGLDQITTSLSEAITPDRITADELRIPLIESLLNIYQILFSEGGAAAITKTYSNLAFFPPGTQVQWSASNRDQSGHVMGLGSHGELLVKQEGNRVVPLFAEEVSFQTV